MKSRIQMSKIEIILLIVLYLIVSQRTDCQNTKNLTAFDMKEQLKVVDIKLSELGFRDIEILPLETSDKNPLQRITGIRFGNNYILIQDYTTLLKFDNNGHFKTQIGKPGRGPHEFTVLHDFDIDDKNGRIYLVSGWQRKFFVFNENGKFIRTFPCPLNTTNFRITGDGILCYSINSFANITSSYNLLDTAGHILKNYSNKYPFKAPKGRYLVFINENIFYKYNNRLYKKEISSDTIYSFEKQSFNPHAVIYQGKRLITPEVRSNLSPDKIAENYFQQFNLFEFGDYIYYEFLMNGNLFGMIGSRIQNLIFVINPKKGIINDLNGGPNIWPKTIKDNNTLVAWIDALQLKNHVASEVFRKSKPLYPEKKQELERLANSLKETDNPVLVLVSLKK